MAENLDSNIVVTATTDTSGLSLEKLAILEKEKESAIEMIKVANFREGLQDPYPSPFLNLSDFNLPKTSVEVFRWCKYFYTFDPLISGAINSLATFPISDVHLEDIETQTSDSEQASPQLKLYQRVFFKTLNIYKLLIEIGIDYWLYGNCFIFGEMWTNPHTEEKEWKHIVRLDPSRMIIDVNPTTQEKIYKWNVPENIVRIITMKKPKEEYDKIPEIIKRAVTKNQAVVIKASNIYHFSKPSDSMGDSAWGTPPVANVLKLLMYRNILRQAQEAIAREHIVPFRVYFFERTETYNTQVNWSQVAKNFAVELSKSARDPNHKVISPIPVNVLNIGGHGRSLLLTPEIEQIQAEVLAGMNVPREFIFGGISYSGSSISLKILENHFITYRLLLKDFMQSFIIKNMAKVRGDWNSDDDDASLVTVRMTDLKMQDDVQQKQIIINLNGAGKITDELLWKVVGVDAQKMKEALRKEALDKVKLESEVRSAQAELGFELQKRQLEQQFQLQALQMQLQAKYGMPPQDQTPPQGQPPQGQPPQGQPTQGQPPQGQPPQGQPPQGQPPQGQGISVEDVAKKLLEMDQQTAQQYLDQLPGDIRQHVENAMAQIKGQAGFGRGYMDAHQVARKLLTLSEQERNQVLSKMPGNEKQKVLEAFQHLHAEQQKDAKIDMRQMPEQLPPRRNSLK